MPSYEFLLSHYLQAFDENNNLNSQEQTEKLEGLFTDFLTFVEIMNHLNHAHALNKKEAENFSWEEL